MSRAESAAPSYETLMVVGVSHKSAPIGIRERFALSDERLAAWAEGVVRSPGVSECIALSTCHRTECYLSGRGAVEVESAARAAMCDESGLGAEGNGYLRALEGERAVRHLFRVAGGLESIIAGEPQIQGQVRSAYMAAQARSAGPVLHRLFQSALATGGQIRAQTSIARGATSIPAAALDLARKKFGSLGGRTVLVLGTGEMGRLTVRCLQQEGVRRVYLASRSIARAERVGRSLGTVPALRADAARMLRDVDLLVTCTESEASFLGAKDIRGNRPAHSPLVILDIAVPRNVDPRAALVGDVCLYNVDDLQKVVDLAREERESERVHAEEIVDRSAGEYWAWRRGRAAAPVVRALRDTAGRIVSESLAARPSGPNGAEQERRQASLAALQRVLHGPTRAIRWLAEQPGGKEWLQGFPPGLGRPPDARVSNGSGESLAGAVAEAEFGRPPDEPVSDGAADHADGDTRC